MNLPTWYDRYLTAGADPEPEHICQECGEFLELNVDPEGSEWHCPNQTKHTK